ncbi:proline--tRNA ligase [bacterium]|jgi:prolyl-tRNA synthetase|nr:proline--tRNA ligase [bacterium]
MKYSKFFGKTLKKVSSDLKIDSHKLLVQAGYIAESVAGRYYMLPLGMLVQNKLVDVIQKHMNKADAQQMLAPVCHPLELWQETNRDAASGFDLTLVEDRRGAKFALGGTAEEMFVDIVRRYNLSYKDLPFNIYQFGYKFRDEKRARGGLLRVREFLMKDAYAFCEDEKQFSDVYKQMADSYFDIFNELGLTAHMVPADNGFIGGEYCHEFIVDTEVGESRYLAEKNGDYHAHEDIAVSKFADINLDDPLEELTTVEASRAKTVAAGAELHNLPLERQIKNVAFKSRTLGVVLAVIRADVDVNVRKLENLLGVLEDDLEPLEASDVIDLLGSYPGFISPVGIKDNLTQGVKLTIVADNSLQTFVNGYTGANKKNHDMMNVNFGRDFTADLQGDIALAQPGHVSANGLELVEKRGVEVGNIFQNGFHYTAKMKGADFTAANNQVSPLYMGCFGIGIGRTLQTVVEIQHDDRGICWPKSISPFQVHLVGINCPEYAQEIYNKLQAAGFDVLFDDRDQRPGTMLYDADLIGIAVRVVASQKLEADAKLEFKLRTDAEHQLVDIDDCIRQLNEFYA